MKMIGQAKAVVPTVGDQSSAAYLAAATKKLALALSQLKAASAQVCFVICACWM